MHRSIADCSVVDLGRRRSSGSRAGTRWRKKHDPYYVGYTGTPWERDYEITSGHCNREAIATVIGGVVGGVVGSKVSSPEDRTVATIVGVIIGAAIGNKIGKELDEADRGCFGHTLEVGAIGQRVTWTNDATGGQVRDVARRGPSAQRHPLSGIHARRGERQGQVVAERGRVPDAAGSVAGREVKSHPIRC